MHQVGKGQGHLTGTWISVSICLNLKHGAFKLWHVSSPKKCCKRHFRASIFSLLEFN